MKVLLDSPRTVVPFHYLREGVPLLMVHTRVNGEGPYEFILDTGNGLMGIALSPEVAENLNITTHPESVETKFPVGFSKTVSMGKIDLFQLGELRVGATEVAVHPALSELGQRMGASVDGNIGYHFLKEYVMSLDFATRTLTLSQEEPKGESVPMHVGKDKPLIVIDVESNGEPMRFVLDTGASYNCISLDAADRLGLKRGAEFPVNGSPTEKASMCTLASLSLAGKTRTSVGIAATDFLKDLSAATDVEIDGVLGYTFWSHYRVTIDYPRKRLFLAER